MSELKPCPFCGGKVLRVKGFGEIIFIKCSNCGATVSFDNCFCNAEPDKADEAWNSRAGENHKRGVQE